MDRCLGTGMGLTDLYAETLKMMERYLLTRVLSETQGNQSRAAEILGITRGKIRSASPPSASHSNMASVSAQWPTIPTGGKSALTAKRIVRGTRFYSSARITDRRHPLHRRARASAALAFAGAWTTCPSRSLNCKLKACCTGMCGVTSFEEYSTSRRRFS